MVLKRTKAVQVKLTAQEKQKLEELANQLGLSVSAYVRFKLLSDESK